MSHNATGGTTGAAADAPLDSQPGRRAWLVALSLPIVVTGLSLLGARAGLYQLDVGLTLLVTGQVLVIVGLGWFVARRWLRLDARQRHANTAEQATVATLVQTNAALQAEVAERRRVASTSRASEERFFAMFASSPIGMVLSSLPDLRYVAVNDGWLRMTGFSRDDVIGRTAEEVGMLSPEERAALYARADRDGNLRDADFQFRARNGASRHGLVTTQHLTVNDDTYEFTTLVDITDRVRAEDDLRDSNRRLEAALAELRVAQRQIMEQERIGALGQLASGIAHDFNNTLGPILGYSDLLLANPDLLTDTETANEYLRSINTAAQGAAAVVSRLRDFYRRRQNGDADGPAHLPDLIAQAISLTRPRWKDVAQANGAMIEIVVDVSDVPPIEGSPSEIRDALVNLILNAADAMPAGGTIAIRAHAETSLSGQAATTAGGTSISPSDAPGSTEVVVVEVTDNGTGMTEDVRRRCFEPFYTTKGEQGTGLGLSIVHGTLRRHGGTLEIETMVGQGTTMRLRLPARRNTEVTTQLPEPRATTRQSLRILVVDDEPMIRQVVSRFLEIDEHAVEVAANGREALARLQAADRFDLVITDRAMPEMGGDELAAMVKVLAPTTPVIMLTGFADLMEAADQWPAGVDLVIGKPTTLARLRVAIATVVPDQTSARTYDRAPE